MRSCLLDVGCHSGARYRHLLALTVLLLFSRASSAAAEPDGLRPWRDYHAIMWVGDSAFKKPDKIPLFFERMREMGIDTGMVHGQAEPDVHIANKFPFYVENMVSRGLCLKWNSKVIDWDKFVTDWVREGRPDPALVRDYCLDDPEWQNWARTQMQTGVRKNSPHHPLAYDIRDELSVTISANPFDYDFSPTTLRAFRAWLKTQYKDVAALNAQWETQFNSWEEVKPFTTDQVKNRMGSGQALPRGNPDWSEVRAVKFDLEKARKEPTRWNFSPWADFRSYMDLSLARELGGIRQAAHELDPRTPVGIEGTQMPHAFGGYDLWRMSQVLDWVEPYDIGNAREIFGSFMPGKPLLTTVFETSTDSARRRLWHLLLEGDRGCIIWWSEDCIDWNSPDYALTAKAKALAPVLREMTSPLAKLFLRAERVRDPIFIHYSQTSIQADWLIESTVDGSTWLRRFSSFESEHNKQAKIRNAWVKVFQDLGYSPQFLSTEQIENGALPRAGQCLLVLPESWALSDKEFSEVEILVQKRPPQKPEIRGVIFDGTPGAFDGHGKLRRSSPFDIYYPLSVSSEPRAVALLAGRNPASRTGEIAQHSVDRLKEGCPLPWSEWLSDQLLPLAPAVKIPVTARTRVHRFRAKGGELIAFERNINYQMSEELKQAGGNESLEKPHEVEAKLQQKYHVYNLWEQRYLGQTDSIRFTLDPWKPALFGLTTNKVPEQEIITRLTLD